VQAVFAGLLPGDADARILTTVTFRHTLSSNTVAANLSHPPLEDVEVTMWRKLAVALAPVGSATGLPARALAQGWGPWTEDGSWFMWGGGWSWWWICPLMMIGMMVVMMFACRFMGCGWHRD